MWAKTVTDALAFRPMLKVVVFGMPDLADAGIATLLVSTAMAPSEIVVAKATSVGSPEPMAQG